ncbi:MAG: hypothetical protein H8E55_45390 [Pelagibacterales bacterium]|jgi:hypothetical protein|nr:hypothetical protein [Pelagibacterales bacterium]MDA7780649.1 hypothetical protein [Candidatus Pelagibacter sp.]MDA9996616.1 hypothetical protein [Candidatus Pelagibacter sp.]|tara:strand:+ start:86 stop:649 length:564 start_codon:yes stop_codon:yes gene_type:complete
MIKNIKISNILVYFFVYLIFAAHSPWGQYLAYREQHLLIMSTREDAPTYPYSKILIDVINKELPEASARAARAKTFRRVQGLFSTNQMPLLLLSKKNARALLKGNGVFKKYGAADAKVIYFFDDLVLLAQPSFPDKFAWMLTNAITKGEKDLLGATSPLETKKITDIHPGTIMALNNEKMPELLKAK